MTIRLEFHDTEFVREISRATAEGLQAAAVFLYEKCRQAVNESNNMRHKVRFTAAQRAKRGGQKTGTVYENMHNQWAEFPPFKRTGHGQSGIVWEYNGSHTDPKVRVGVSANAMYMIYLELGTRRIKARPWLVAMLRRYKTQIARLAVSKFKRRRA